MTRLRVFILILVSLLSAGISYFFASPQNRGYDSRSVRFPNIRGEAVYGTLYAPRVQSRKDLHPAVVSIHYGLQNRETLQPASSAMAESGIIVLNLILNRRRDDGRGRTIADYIDDINGSVDFLTLTDNVDPDRIFLSGHSIGGNLACVVGESNPRVAGVAPVGYPVDFSPHTDKPMLLASGIFDELHPASSMIEAFRQTAHDSSPGQVLHDYREIPGAIKNGEPVRILFFSHNSDHCLEPVDYNITTAIISFIHGVNGSDIPGSPALLKYYLTIISRPVLFLCVLILWSWFLMNLWGGGHKGHAVTHLFNRFPQAFFLFIFLALGLFYRPDEHIIPVVILSGIFVSTLFFNHLNRKFPLPGNHKENFCPSARYRQFQNYGLKILCYCGLMYLCFTVGLYFHAGLYPYSTLKLFFKTLPGIFPMATGILFVALTRINGLFLAWDWMFRFTSGPIWILMILEFFRPGAVIQVLDQFFSRMVKAMRNLDFSIKWQFNLSGAVLLSVLLIAGVMIWNQVLAEGYGLSVKDLWGLLYLFLCFIIIPGSLFTLLLRVSPKIKKMRNS